MDMSRVTNPQALIGVFGPSLTFINSQVLEVRFKEDGPTVFLRFMTKETVINRPKRWPEKSDVVYVEVSFAAAKEVHLSGWGTTNIVKCCQIKAVDAKGILCIECSNGAEIQFEFDWAIVEELKPGLIGTL